MTEKSGVSQSVSPCDPAREFLERSRGQRVIVWADAADVAYERNGGFVPEGKNAYVGRVEELHDWGLVCGGWGFRWATRWDLINWSANADAFPVLDLGPPVQGGQVPDLPGMSR